MSSFLTSLDLYLAHASTAGLTITAALGIVTVGLGPWAIADLIQHIAAVRNGKTR